MIVSVADTQDPNGRPLRFDWTLLQGDTDRVQIEPLDDAGLRARVRIGWHDSFTLGASSAPLTLARQTSRVDIGVFANNGVHDSAPAMISVLFPTHQRRVYEEVAGQMQLISIDYDAESRSDPADPRLFWTAPWRDVYSYDASGEMTGFIRETPTGQIAFDADGARTPGDPVRYRINRRTDALPQVTMTFANDP